MLPADPRSLSLAEVLGNLIENAARHARSRGASVRVRMARFSSRTTARALTAFAWLRETFCLEDAIASSIVRANGRWRRKGSLRQFRFRRIA